MAASSALRSVSTVASVELAAGLHDRDVFTPLDLDGEGLEIGHLGRSS